MRKFFIRTLSSRLFLIIVLFLYRVSIDLSYIYVISPKYGYSGFDLDINQLKVFESYVLLFIFSLLLKHKINKPSEFFILFLFSMLGVPILSIYSMQNKSKEFLYMILLSFIVIIVSSKIKQIKFPVIRNGYKFAIAISLLTGVFLFSWIIIRGGLSYLNFNLLKVYDFRRKVAELVFPGILSYIMSWFGKVMNPLLIAFSLWKKNKKMVILTIGVQVLFFAITAHKSMLFYPVLIIFSSIFGRKKYLGQMIPLGLAGVTIISSIYYYITDNLILLSLFIRRVLFVTALNHYRYYDAFKELGFLYFSNRAWFPKIIEYPFELPVPQVISLIYNGHPNTWVNTGFLASGYINGGLTCMLIYSFIVGLVFRFIDYIAKNYLPSWLCIAIMIVPIFGLVNADLPTALFNHGILLAMIMLWLISNANIMNNKNILTIKIH